MKTEFSHSLHNLARPSLAVNGFSYDGKRRFMKKDFGDREFIIEYQLGVGVMAGKFTINLIAGDKHAWIGLIRSTPFSRVVQKLFGAFDPWWKTMLLPKDKWWRINASQQDMDKAVRETLVLLESFGLPWFDKTAQAFELSD